MRADLAHWQGHLQMNLPRRPPSQERRHLRAKTNGASQIISRRIRPFDLLNDRMDRLLSAVDVSSDQHRNHR